MKKFSVFLSALILVGCGSQNITPPLAGDSFVQSAASVKKAPAITAKSAYPVALKEAKKLLSKPQLFEIDIWKETTGDNIHFGFMQKNSNTGNKYIRIIIDRQTGLVSNEPISDNGKVPAPVNLTNWKIDSEEILNIAQSNGLKDPTYLATLWENTWHITGLKQDLYFQINSKTGKIEMICTDPYMQQCTDAANNPITPGVLARFQKKLNVVNK